MKTIATIKARYDLTGILFVVQAIALVGLPTLSYSQVLEEIIVTAQKREQNLQDVGVSVTAFTDILQILSKLTLQNDFLCNKCLSAPEKVKRGQMWPNWP